MNDLTTDILIIGSGPAGISAAWPLVLAGRKTMMIDAGGEALSPPLNISRQAWTSTPDRWRAMYGKNIAAAGALNNISPKFRTPLAQAVIQGGDGLLPRMESRNFIAARAGNAGGLSAIWGAFCSGFDDIDLKDAPIKADDLKDAYASVARRIGISGAMDDLGAFYGDYPLLEPGAMTAPARRLFDNYSRSQHADHFALGRARNAVLTQAADPASGRQACNQCGMCLYGCARGSIYDSRHDIGLLRTYENFTYLPRCAATAISAAGSDNQIIETTSGPVSARTVLLAAGTINSTALVMDFLKQYDIPRRILSNPVMAGAFLVPSLIGKDMPGETFALGQLGYRLQTDGAEYATGVIYGTDTLEADNLASRMPLSRPAARLLSKALLPATLIATCYLSGAYSDNEMILSKKDGKLHLSLSGNIPQAARRQLAAAKKRLSRNLARYGAYGLPGSFTVAPPGADCHLAGTMPMGGEDALSCDRDCRMDKIGNIFAVDGSWLPHLPPKHLTLTLMANAERMARKIAQTS